MNSWTREEVVNGCALLRCDEFVNTLTLLYTTRARCCEKGKRRSASPSAASRFGMSTVKLIVVLCFVVMNSSTHSHYTIRAKCCEKWKRRSASPSAASRFGMLKRPSPGSFPRPPQKTGPCNKKPVTKHNILHQGTFPGLHKNGSWGLSGLGCGWVQVNVDLWRSASLSAASRSGMSTI